VSQLDEAHKKLLTNPSAIIFLFRTAVGSIFTAVFVAILTNKVPEKLAAIVPPAVIKAGLPASSIPDLFAAITLGTPAALAAVPGINPQIEVVLGAALSNAYAAAYKYVYYAAVAVGLVGLIACFCVRDYDQYFNNHVPRQIYRAKDGKLIPGEKPLGDEKGSEQNSNGKDVEASHVEVLTSSV
jgi:Fungal trichothecene efflux pump (TRI12)